MSGKQIETLPTTLRSPPSPTSSNDNKNSSSELPTNNKGLELSTLSIATLTESTELSTESLAILKEIYESPPVSPYSKGIFPSPPYTPPHRPEGNFSSPPYTPPHKASPTYGIGKMPGKTCWVGSLMNKEIQGEEESTTEIVGEPNMYTLQFTEHNMKKEECVDSEDNEGRRKRKREY